MSQIKQNLEIINQKILEIEQKSGRPQGSVKLMAVSKFHPVDAVIEALQAGQALFGENRVQEAYSKFKPVFEEYSQTELHMIGQLQTNKVKHAVEIASCIESVDRIELLQEIEKQCAKLNKQIKVLFEYHTGEESKSGFTSDDKLYEALEECKNGQFPHIIPAGFMTMAPFTDDKEIVRKSFITLRCLAQKLKNEYPMFNLDEL
jgi:pyridoxal phosphate enzyme (YggS family)